MCAEAWSFSPKPARGYFNSSGEGRVNVRREVAIWPACVYMTWAVRRYLMGHAKYDWHTLSQKVLHCWKQLICDKTQGVVSGHGTMRWSHTPYASQCLRGEWSKRGVPGSPHDQAACRSLEASAGSFLGNVHSAESTWVGSEAAHFPSCSESQGSDLLETDGRWLVVRCTHIPGLGQTLLAWAICWLGSCLMLRRWCPAVRG